MSKWRARMGYGVADLASNLVFQMMSSYLMIFYTDVFGIAAAAAGTLMLVTRVIDAFTDVGMGMLIDRTHTKWGKCRPYFLFGAIPFALIAIATFTVPNFGPSGKLVYAYVTYIALSCAYTVVNIPLTAILPSLTDDSKEQTIMVSVRMICSMAGATIVTTFTTPLVNALGGGNAARGYFITIVIYAVVAAALFFVTFANTEEKVKAVVSGEKTNFKRDVKSLNGPAIQLFLYAFLLFVVFTIRSTSIVYYFTYNLNRENLVPMIGVLGTLSGLPVLLLLPYITGKIGKRNSSLLGGAIFIAGTLLIYFGGTGTAPLMIGLVVTGCGVYLMQSTMFAIAPDVQEYCKYKSGHDISGLVTAIYGFMAKLGMGVSAFALGKFLTWGGYVANQEQTPKALLSIQISFVGITIVFTALIMIMMLFYKLDKELPEIQKKMKKNA